MNVEHSDVRAFTQGVYSCLVKRLLKDYRQQHPQTSDSHHPLYICGNIIKYTENIHAYQLFLGISRMREQIIPGPFFLPHKKWPGNEATSRPACAQTRPHPLGKGLLHGGYTFLYINHVTAESAEIVRKVFFACVRVRQHHVNQIIEEFAYNFAELYLH